MSVELLFITSFVVGFTGAMAPGPLLTVTITETARSGFRAGPLLIAGHVLLELFLVLALSVGLAAFLLRAEVTVVIAVIGGIFLLWMGYAISRDALQGKASLSVQKSAGEPWPAYKEGASSNWRLIGLGVLTSISNPYFTLWWATVGLGYMTFSLQQGYLGLAAFFTGHILADFTWYALVSAMVVGSGRFLKPWMFRVVLTACGVFLLALGVYFIYSGLVNGI